ncbi:hypothetical protein HDV06_005891 [Boothiomyces sp. JEL0866]|nr:hypothetical protein HDV06_005891 [Boothiomyces sp. JEL0866]
MNTSVNIDVPDVFQIAWASNEYCNLAPTVMYQFSRLSTTLYQEISFEQYSLSSCGNNVFPMNEGCCFSNLDRHYISGFSSVVQRKQFVDKPNFPASANGAAYCHLKQANENSLFGYSEIWVLSDSTCIDSFFKCSDKGEFQYFQQPGCTGTANSALLQNSLQNFNLESMGNITGELVTITNGLEVYTWTAYIPSAMLVLNYQSQMECVALFCYIFAMVVSFAVLVYFVLKFVRTRSLYLTVVVISQILWLLWIILDFSYLNIVFPASPSALAQQYAELRGCIFNFAAITTVLNTANFIIGFQPITENYIKMAIYGAIVILHLILAGGNYFTYWYLSYGNGSFWQKWIHLVPLWTVLMFIFNTVPSFAIAIPLVKNSEYLRKMSTFSAIRKLLVIDKKFASLVLLQSANTVSVLVFYYIQQFTESLGSDRNFLSMSGVLALLYALHTGINCLFIEHIRVVLLLGIGYSSSAGSGIPHSALSSPLAIQVDNNAAARRVSALLASPVAQRQDDPKNIL